MPSTLGLGNLYGTTLQLPLSDSADKATDQTIAAMIAFVHNSDRTQLVHRLATFLASRAPRRDYLAQLRQVYDFIVEHVQFKRDTAGVGDHVRHPDQLISEISEFGMTAADCDDVATLGAALVRAMGFPAIITVVSPAAVGPFVHVYFGAEYNGMRVAMDPQERIPFGQDPPHGRLKHYRVEAP